MKFILTEKDLQILFQALLSYSDELSHCIDSAVAKGLQSGAYDSFLKYQGVQQLISDLHIQSCYTKLDKFRD